MKVKDVMIKKVKSIAPDMPVGQALDLLLENKISGLPVVDKEDKLVGMFTEKDIIKYILPGYLEKVGAFVYEDNPKSIKNKVRQVLGDRKVKDIMRREVITVGPETTLSEVARTMLIEKVRRIPVVDKERKIIGIISREDILKEFIKEEA